MQVLFFKNVSFSDKVGNTLTIPFSKNMLKKSKTNLNLLAFAFTSINTLIFLLIVN